MDTICKYCGKAIKARPSRLQKITGNLIYCSKLCQHKATYQQVICLICGKIFEAPQSANRKYCSMACRNQRIAWNKGKPWSEELKAKLKASCPDHKGIHNPHYNPNKPIRRCRICKRQFRPSQKQVDEGYGIYCSHACYLKNKGETDIEKRVREKLNQLGELYHPQYKIGYWTVDFYLPFRSLVIEVDGNFWHSSPGAKRRDKAKDTFLTRRGYKVIRLLGTIIKSPEFALADYLHNHTNP